VLILPGFWADASATGSATAAATHRVASDKRLPPLTLEEPDPIVAPSGIAVALLLSLSARTNPYDPGQRAVGSGLIGAGAGAAIGGAVGGGTGAAIGAASGGALGAITGAATTSPPPPPPRY